MCGIAGIVSVLPRPLGRTLGQMSQALEHRGPDGVGFIALNPGEPCPQNASDTPPNSSHCAFLAHRRLSIIDLAGSRQPLPNEDGSVWVVFNGEIYNYKELADKLAGKGHRLREKGDTEVLVHLYEEYRDNLFEHLNGMFSVAIYDVKEHRLILARDRFGEKPLYYWETGGLLAFASELQGLWPLEEFPIDNVELSAMAQYFRYGYIPTPLTIYPGVHSLSPGHFIVWNNGELGPARAYYAPQVHGQNPGDNADELEDRFDLAVCSRLTADVPVGCFLSGGLDSSLIASSMVKISSHQVRSFTIRLDDDVLDESVQAKAIAAHLGTRHTEYSIKPDFLGAITLLARHYGQPFADYSSVPTYYISRETRRDVKVALSGDGGDELFAGYDRYSNQRVSDMAALVPSSLRMFSAAALRILNTQNSFIPHLADFLNCASKLPERGENHTSLFHSYWRDRCFQPDFASITPDTNCGKFTSLYKQCISHDTLDRWLETDQRMYLPNDILTKVDIASMAASLETRAPFLDHRFTEYVNGLFSTDKIKNKTTKYLLRRLAERRLPENVAKLPKKGFTLPLARWLRNELREWGLELLKDHQDAWTPYLVPTAIWRLWDAHQSGRADHSMRLWQVISVCLWDVTKGTRASSIVIVK